jgi:hypothetical protein
LDDLTESVTGKQTTTDSTLPSEGNEVEKDVKGGPGYSSDIGGTIQTYSGGGTGTMIKLTKLMKMLNLTKKVRRIRRTKTAKNTRKSFLHQWRHNNQPTEGEEIYGRVIGSSAQKYTPPARRKELVSAIDGVSQ